MNKRKYNDVDSSTLPPEYTGITSGLGGAIQPWSCLGGSRLILSKADAAGSYKYIKFDCTKEVKINFSTDLSGLNCGLVAAFYMIPMGDNSSLDQDRIRGDETGALYNDAQGIGFVDVGNTGLYGQRGRPELDLLETSGRAAQTTVHACKLSTDQPTPSNRWNPGAHKEWIDMDGLWNNANVVNGKFITRMNFGNSKKFNYSPSYY